MSLRVTVACDGHRDGQPCRGARSSGLAYSPRDRWQDNADRLPAIVPRLVDGWRQMPNGGDLCPSGGHDEDVTP